jgi:hypothetical protein
MSSTTSSMVGPWGMMADGTFYAEGSTCSATSVDWLADVGADVGTGMDFCRFCRASVLVKALRFTWVSATVGWGHRHLLIVELEHLVCLPMCPFVAVKQV